MHATDKARTAMQWHSDEVAAGKRTKGAKPLGLGPPQGRLLRDALQVHRRPPDARPGGRHPHLGLLH
eukprot:14215548-Alexandrium_andersonii.AAC.1